MAAASPPSLLASSSAQGSNMAASAAAASGAAPAPRVRFKTHFQNTVLDVMRHMGWEQVPEDAADWEVYWCDVGWVRDAYTRSSVPENARICHFANHHELTRKDHIAKNLKKLRRRLEREQGKAAGAVCDFMPETFWLPLDYAIFVEAFKRMPGSVWIMKPVGSAQGKGIFLITKLSEILAFKKDNRFLPAEEREKQDAPPAYIVQRYIENPYLIGGKKFDLRLYVLVTSYQPLQCWFYREGFARFSGAPFSMEDLSNSTVHLTNVAIQKQSAGYDSTKGCKWLFSQVKRYLQARHGREAVNTMMRAIDEVFLTCLKAVQPAMTPDKHCFELYGFDVLIDSMLGPWLIEVNASPSLTADTPTDYALKHGLLTDMFTIVDIEKRRTGQETRVGGFDLVWDDGPVLQPELYPGQPDRQLNSLLGAYNGDRAMQLAGVVDRGLALTLEEGLSCISGPSTKSGRRASKKHSSGSAPGQPQVWK